MTSRIFHGLVKNQVGPNTKSAAQSHES